MENQTVCLKLCSILGLLLFASSATSAEAESLQIPAIQVVGIEDEATKRQYELYIKLPENYDPKGETQHPVIYIADALWHIEIISGSIGFLIEDAILVGLSWEKGSSAQRSRMRDYMPNKYTGTNWDHPTGLAHQHLEFIRTSVLPYVETSFRADPERRSFFGYSVSGTFGGYILLSQPDTFKNYIIGSPATLFDDHFLHEYEAIAKTIPESFNANVFVSVGADEEWDHIEHAISLVRFLNSKKSDQSVVDLEIIESADHNKAFPMTAMRSLYWLAELAN
jgi:predicted alpha/beta superfamily hydrolase